MGRLTAGPDLTDVSFYPYGKKGEDPVFAVVGIGLIVIYRYKRENSEKGQIVWLYGYRDEDDFRYIDNDDPQKEAKTSPNLGEKDDHQRSRCIASARNDEYLPVFCVTGQGDIQPPKPPNADSHAPKTFPPIAVNTLIKAIISYTGERIQTLIGHDDKQIYLWSLAEAHTKAPCIAVIGGWGHIDRVLSLAWHPKGEWLLSGGFDNRVCLWHVSVSALDLPRYNDSCGEWVAKQMLMPYFVSSEVHRHPVERVAWMDDTIISHGMAEPYITQWRITGFSSRTLTEMLPSKPSFQDEDAIIRSAWDLTGRDKVQNPLYRRILRFGVPVKQDEMLDDPWCEKRRFVDFDVYVPAKRFEEKASGREDHAHATLAVCEGESVLFWDFNRLLAWPKESRKLKQGQILELPWEQTSWSGDKAEEEIVAEEETVEVDRHMTPPSQLARIDPDDPEAETMKGLTEDASAMKVRSIENKRKGAELASANSTPTKPKPAKSQKTAVRKTAPSIGGVPSETAGPSANSESVTSSSMFRRESMVAKRKREEQERAEKRRLNSIKALPDVPERSHISGQKAAQEDEMEDAVASFRIAQGSQPRKRRNSLGLKSRIELRLGKENKRGDDKDQDKDSDHSMGLNGARSPRPAKMASRKTAPSTGGMKPEYGLGMDGGGDERPRQPGTMYWESVRNLRAEPGFVGVDHEAALGERRVSDISPRGGAVFLTALSTGGRQMNICLSLDGASDETPRRYGMMSLTFIAASRAARGYTDVERRAPQVIEIQRL